MNLKIYKIVTSLFSNIHVSINFIGLAQNIVRVISRNRESHMCACVRQILIHVWDFYILRVGFYVQALFNAKIKSISCLNGILFLSAIMGKNFFLTFVHTILDFLQVLWSQRWMSEVKM